MSRSGFEHSMPALLTRMSIEGPKAERVCEMIFWGEVRDYELERLEVCFVQRLGAEHCSGVEMYGK